jgi:hypothetical protein
MDPILFVGGCAFIALSFLSFFDRDRLWRIYSMEKGWRRRHPERTPEWDAKTQRHGRIFLFLGLSACLFSFLGGG